ncbi:uncharacterized mitochondrial protein-like protein [Tanacetum coccineum]
MLFPCSCSGIVIGIEAFVQPLVHFSKDGPPISDAPFLNLAHRYKARQLRVLLGGPVPNNCCLYQSRSLTQRLHHDIHMKTTTPTSDSDEVSSHRGHLPVPLLLPSHPKGIQNPALNSLNADGCEADEMEALKTKLYFGPCTTSHLLLILLFQMGLSNQYRRWLGERFKARWCSDLLKFQVRLFPTRSVQLLKLLLTVYMEQPPGFIDPQFPNHVCKLSKALYGLKQAPRAWFHRLSSFLLAHGFVCSRADTSLFVFTKDSCIMYFLVYVDDLILTGNNESLLTSFTTRLNQEFAIKDLGDLSYFLGLEVDLFSANPTLYRSLVGALQYLTITRPDLSYAVNQASQFLHAPTDAHFQSVKRILRYVKGTITYGLIFRRPHSNSILGYSDADWARCIEPRRTNTAAEIIWITHLLRELHALPPDRPTLLCDNKSALFMSQNPVSHKRAKHIDLDYHFVRELVASGKLYTKFIPTKLQVADIFTKSLPRPQFEYFRSLLRLGPPPIRLRGDIR